MSRRASASQIMAEIRSEYSLTVRDAWDVYRTFRDELKEEGLKPSLRAVSRHEDSIREIVVHVTTSGYDEYEEPPDYDYEWEITGIYD